MGILSSIGKLFGGAVKLTEQDMSVSEQKTAVVDSLAPRTVCYGDGAWQASLAWRQSHKWGVNALEPKQALTDVMVVGDHPFESVDWLWLDDERQSVGTDGSASGDFWIPADVDATGAADDYNATLETAQWNVPNRDLAVTPIDFQRTRNSDNQRIPIGAWKFWDGSQTTQLRNDAWLALVPGWTDVTRDGRNMGVLAVTWSFEVNDRVTPGKIPAIMIEGQGKNDVYDWRTSTSIYTNNPALCLADALMWEYFPWQRVNSSWAKSRLTIANFNTAAMQSAANLCDETSTSFTGKRYAVNGFQISADTDPEQIFEDFSIAMGGMQVTLIDDKIAIIPGGPRSWVAGFDFSDLSAGPGIITPTRRDRQSRYNTIVSEYRRAQAGWEFDDADPVTAAAYLSDDQDKRRTSKLKINAIGGTFAKERAQRLAKIILDRHRLEDAATITVHGLMGVDTVGSKAAALRVREGDIVRLTYPRKGWTDKEFEVMARTWDWPSFEMTFELAEWSQSIDWDGLGIVPDEALERGELWRGGLAAVTGLSAAVVTGSAYQQTDGTVWVETEVDWDDHPETLVAENGTYRIRWKTAAMSKYASSVADSSRKRLTLVANIEHTIEVRPEALGTVGDWATLVFTPQGVSLPQPITDPTLGPSLHSNPFFDRDLDGWVDISTSGGAATLITESTDLSFPLGGTNQVLQLDTGPAGSDKGAMSWEETVPVIPGGFLHCEVTLVSRNIGTAYGAGNHNVGVSLAWKEADDDAIDNEAAGGPIRSDEELIAAVGPVAFGASRSDPGAHDVHITVANVVQVPRGGYGIRRVRVFVQAFNDGQEARWDCAQVLIRKTDHFPGRQRKSNSITGGDPTKATRSAAYRTLVGMSNRAVYNGVSGQDMVAEFTGRLRVDASAASNPVQGYVRFVRLLESVKGLTDPTTDGSTEIVDVIDDDEDDVLDEYELAIGSVVPIDTGSNVGPWVDMAFAATIPMPALPDAPAATGLVPTQSDRWVIRLQGVTDRANGTIRVRGGNLSLRQIGSSGVLVDL